MEIMHGSKHRDAGRVPEAWTLTTLGEHVNITSGESPSKFRFKSDGIPYFKVDQLNDSSKVLWETPYLIEGERRVQKGSIIFPKRGASILLNKVRILAVDSFMDTNLMSLTPKASIHGEFLYYSLVHTELWRIADITSIPQINNKHIIPLPLVLPNSRAEQEAIAEALSDTDALIESLEQLLAKKRQIKQGAMQELLTGKRRLQGFETTKGYKQTDIGSIPVDWDCSEIGGFIDLLAGFPFPSNKYSETGVRLLRGSNVKRGELDWSQDITTYWAEVTTDIRCYLLEAGDIVVAMDGSLVGRSFAALVENDTPALLLQRVARIRAKEISQEYLKVSVCSSRFTWHCDAVKTTTAIPHISPADIRSFRIAIPPTRAEQNAIATVLSDMDAEITALEEKLAKVRQLKQGMMQELLTGRIRLV